MIKKLIDSKQDYFWTKTDDNTIIVNGQHEGRIFGQIQIYLDSNFSMIQRDISNSVSEVLSLSNLRYPASSPEYVNIQLLFEKVSEYLKEEKTIQYQEKHREILIRNIQNLLPKYSDIN